MGTPVLNYLRSRYPVRLWTFNGGHAREVFGSGLDFTLTTGGTLVNGGIYVDGAAGTVGITPAEGLTGTEFSVIAGSTCYGKVTANLLTIASDVAFGAAGGWMLHVKRSDMSYSARFYNAVTNKQPSAVAASAAYGKYAVAGFSYKDNDASGIQMYVNGLASGSVMSTAGFAILHRNAGIRLGDSGVGGDTNDFQGLEQFLFIIDQHALTAQEHASLTTELNSISYPTAVYEIRPPDYPTIKDGTPSFALCCGETTDKANGVTPTTATAVERKKDTQMADYLQFTRASSSKLDYGIQTQNQLNAEFEWDGDVYFDTASVGQVTEIIKVGDSATGVCWGLRKTATEKFQFIYGNELTVDFTYSVPSLGPLHIVLRREWVSGSTYDVKLWINGSFKEALRGSYAGTGNASARTYLGYSGNVTNTNYLSGRIYYSHIYPHLRPVEKFQRDPFSKNMALGWGVRANNTVNTVERDTDNVVTVVSGGATFKVNSGFGDTGKLQKWLETGAGAATFRIRNISSNDGLTVYYRDLTTRTWTQGDGSAGDLTVDATGLFTLAANRAMLWSEL